MKIFPMLVYGVMAILLAYMGMGADSFFVVLLSGILFFLSGLCLGSEVEKNNGK